LIWKMIKAAVYGFSLFLVLFSACSHGPGQSGLIVAGSTSIQPFADRWAEVYMEKRRGAVVTVQGGGSSAGIQAARSGAAHIGMSSRELKPEESDLLRIEVARDGLAVIVHPFNPLSNITSLQVKSVFNGEVRNWKILNGADHEIDVVTREEGSGTRGAFQEMVMGQDRIFKGAIVQDSNGTVREIVAGNPNSIGFISLGLVNDRVKALHLDGVVPSEESIRRKEYRLVRPFLFVTSGPPGGPARAFIDFVLSDEGQALVKREGILPVR
jgi:phosphate transport system substrate-binding protein